MTPRATQLAYLNPLTPRSGISYEEDCTTSTASFLPATTSSSSFVAGTAPDAACTEIKLADAVIALGVLCGFSIIGFTILLICFIRQSNCCSFSSSGRGRGRGRGRDRTPPCRNPSSPLSTSYRDHLHGLDEFETRSRRRRMYPGLGMIPDERIHRRHSVHESPLAISAGARSPLAPPRYAERAPENAMNVPQVQNAGSFNRSPGRNTLFGNARSPLAMAGYPFMRNMNANASPMAGQRLGLRLGHELMPQAPGQPGMYPLQNQYQPGIFPPEHVHHHQHAQTPLQQMQAADSAAREQVRRRGGSMRQEEGNVGRSRDPSNAGTAVRDDLFSRMRREVAGSRRPSRSETEGSRGRRGLEGGPPAGPAL